MNRYLEYKYTDAVEKYTSILVQYLDGLTIYEYIAVFNELMEDLHEEPVYYMDEIDDLMYGLSFRDAYERINVNCFDFNDDFIRFDETWCEYFSFTKEDAKDIDNLGYDTEDIARELLCLDVSRYTSITDEFIIDVIKKCEEEAGEEIADRFE